MEVRFIYITAGNQEEAKRIGKELVKNRLAACVNIVKDITSFYWWDGELQEAQETVMIAKTKESLVEELVEKVKSMHSYSCPCIVSLPVLQGNGAFLEWVEKETK